MEASRAHLERHRGRLGVGSLCASHLDEYDVLPYKGEYVREKSRINDILTGGCLGISSHERRLDRIAGSLRSGISRYPGVGARRFGHKDG